MTKTAAASELKTQVRTQAQASAAGRALDTSVVGTPYLEVGGGAQTAGAVDDHSAVG